MLWLYVWPLRAGAWCICTVQGDGARQVHGWIGPIKRAGLLLGLLGFMSLMFWMVWAQTLPMAYTWLMGQDAQEQVAVETQRGSGRYSCRHQFKVQEINYLFFEFCISGDEYESLPSGSMPAQLLLQRSYFGKTVQSLALVEPAPLPVGKAKDAEATEPMCVTTVTVGNQTTSTVDPC